MKMFNHIFRIYLSLMLFVSFWTTLLSFYSIMEEVSKGAAVAFGLSIIASFVIIFVFKANWEEK